MLQRTLIWSETMRAVSSAASLTVHIGLAAAVVLGTADVGRSRPARPAAVTVLFPRTVSASRQSRIGSTGVSIPTFPDLMSIHVPVIAVQSGASTTPLDPMWSTPVTTAGAGQGDMWAAGLGQEGPEVLTGPARQALSATLFRPAMVGGRPMWMRVRVPYEFTISSGTRPGR